jgi:hypothetical protein
LLREYLRVFGAGSRFRPTLTRRLALWAAAALLAACFAVVPVSAMAAQVKAATNPLTVDVTGSSLARIVTSPLALTPAFDPAITDYVIRCQTGMNTVHATLSAAGGTINALGGHGASVEIQEDLVENEAMVISARAPRILGPGQRGQAEDVDPNGSVQYWIRCLPHDFPQLSVTKPGNPPPGWYLTSNFTSASGSSLYSMVLDNNGTPVWYRKPGGGQPFNVTPFPNGSIAWAGNGVFEQYNLRTQATRLLSSPDLPLDGHELHVLPNGNVMILTLPSKPHVDLSGLGLGSSATILDCVIEELDVKGGVVWSWHASDHISPTESLHPSGGDIYHCNSVDTDPVTGNVLLSSRHTDAVYLIDKSTGKIIWKMGGSSPNHDHAQILTIKDDPEGVFHAQHDARFQPNGDVSLYDDQSWNASLAARGVEYHIDSRAGTATLVWAFQSPDGRNSLATGSFRRLDGGADNVVGWGIKPNGPLFTEVDARGRVLLSVTFPSGEFSYRVIKVPVTALDHGFLRATAGLPPFVRTTSPKVAFVGVARGPATGGATVTITGAGFTGASAVSFGPNAAAAFTVNNDGLITATAPRGRGVVNVTVTTPGGTSPATAVSILTALDSDIEGEIGSWRSAGSLAASTLYSKSGAYSLQLSPQGKGTESVASDRYSVPPRASVTGSEWVLSPQRSDRVRTFIAFYDSNGALIALTKGPLVTTGSSAWTRVAETTVSPAGTASAALGFEDTSGIAAVYLDSASLSGSDQYSYQPPNGGELSH